MKSAFNQNRVGVDVNRVDVDEIGAVDEPALEGNTPLSRLHVTLASHVAELRCLAERIDADDVGGEFDAEVDGFDEVGSESAYQGRDESSGPVFVGRPLESLLQLRGSSAAPSPYLVRAIVRAVGKLCQTLEAKPDWQGSFEASDVVVFPDGRVDLADSSATPGTRDARAAVASLGTMLYRALTGCCPPSDPATPPPPPSTLLPSDDALLDRRARGELDTIVSRCLAPDPDARFASPAELADALSGV